MKENKQTVISTWFELNIVLPVATIWASCSLTDTGCVHVDTKVLLVINAKLSRVTTSVRIDQPDQEEPR